MELVDGVYTQERQVVYDRPSSPRDYPVAGPGLGAQDVSGELEPPEVLGQSAFSECLADLREGRGSMTPRSRLAFLGSAVLFAAVYGYVTIRCGPIPAVRKVIAGLPGYVGPESRAWLRYSVANALSVAERPADSRPRASRRAGTLAGVVMVAASLSPADANPLQTLPQPAILSLATEESRRASPFLGNK
ncbi:MAG TPA: hypothetical protein VFM05_10850 [Candidatus Saccharimonadales bacterium]|nr:hypothetical protein [Candidatus Saccharimonadales bacterium]